VPSPLRVGYGQLQFPAVSSVRWSTWWSNVHGTRKVLPFRSQSLTNDRVKFAFPSQVSSCNVCSRRFLPFGQQTRAPVEEALSHTILVCLGFAGSGASFFRPWRNLTAEGLDILAPQLPGREWRIDEAPATDVETAIEALLPDVAAAGTGRRMAIFGQCFGAILTFELARRLANMDDIDLAYLFPSGSQAPWSRRERWADGLSDDRLLRRLWEETGYQHEAMADPELRELILPALRADLKCHENYLPGAIDPLDIPVMALRGRDDGLVSADDAREWAKATTASFTLTEFDGGHMYLADAAQPLLTLIESTVAPTNARIERHR
jgi:surfactin synthase thioesterase subunit